MFRRNAGLSHHLLPAEEVFKRSAQVSKNKDILTEYARAFQLSYRSLLNTLRVAESIQDFHEATSMKHEYIHKAFQYKLFRKLRLQYQSVA